jgi:hypothetical protein
MDLDAVLDELGFLKSPNYVAIDKLGSGNRRSHIFRKARSACSLRGVYFLGQRDDDREPMVFVTEAPDRARAFAIHKHVWNQNVVPLLLVNTPTELYLFYAFGLPSEPGSVAGVATTLDEVGRELGIAHAASIDSGQSWAHAPLRSSPASRVDHTLLRQLDQLAGRLHKDGLSPALAYALMGKLLFSRYLRDRNLDKAEAWLGKRGFPVELATLREEHVKQASTALLGPSFSMFEFGFVPVETLASVYQRLLHSTTLGRKLGAYYTPSSLIEFVLGQVQHEHPLTPRTVVLDPSCGSGSFLVPCFRRLVERFLAEHGRISPRQLTQLLGEHLFGVDRDEGACAVARLSLLLTMLDYVDPPALLEDPSFKVLEILDRNIVHANFFSSVRPLSVISGRRFHWVVGNPPWMQVNGERPGEEDRPVLSWIRQNARECPVASNQVAEAFTWRAAQLCAPEGAVGLVLPAISLFKDNPRFWHALSGAFHISSVANFSSFAEVLFENAATAACVITLRPRPVSPGDQTRVFSPLLLNQPEVSVGSDPVAPLSITVDSSEVRSVRSHALSTASTTHWKALVFAGPRDAALLGRLESAFPTLQEWLDRHHFEIFEGPQLRTEHSRDEKIFVEELVGKPTLVTERLRGEGRIHSIPEEALQEVLRDNAYLRLRGGQKPLKVCRPPHVIVGAALNFAAFSDRFIVVPPRQIGIAGDDPALLRMLSLFLSSTVVAYQQFFASPQGGIRGGRTTLDSLRRMPCPLDEVTPKARREWLGLQRRRAQQVHGPTPDPEIDALVFAAFGLDEQETALVEDFVQVTMPLIYGDRWGSGAQEPTRQELSTYARFLKHSLDAAHGSARGRRHSVDISLGADHGVVRVGPGRERGSIRGSPTAEPPALSRLLGGEEPQWIYFNRNRLISRGDEHFLFKPLQRFWWTRARALADSDQLGAAALVSAGSLRAGP